MMTADVRLDDIFDSSVDSAWYLSEYPDVQISKCEPKRHYIEFGRKEGRFPNAYVASIMSISGEVDRKWYLSEYQDVARSGIDPCFHYALYGQQEGRHRNLEEKLISENDTRNSREKKSSKRNKSYLSAHKIQFINPLRSKDNDSLNHDIKHIYFEESESLFRRFVDITYDRIIGRSPSEEELTRWCRYLSTGGSPYTVLIRLARSEEGLLFYDSIKLFRRNN